MREISVIPTVPPEVEALISQIRDIEAKISENEKRLTKRANFILCPICQKGCLYPVERGKILGLVTDEWLICDKCKAEFDKKLGKATLVKATDDPYGVFSKYANQTMPLEKWEEIAFNRINRENNDYEEKISEIKSKIGLFVSRQFTTGILKPLFIELDGFILKKDEVPLFGTRAEIIEERKRRVTRRATLGGIRSYGGFTFRIAKGIYCHTGYSSPTSPRQTIVESSEYTELVTADSGDFLITNQRILFKGNRSRGVSIPMNNIAAINIDTDEKAVMIIQDNKKPVIFVLRTTFKCCVVDIELFFSIDLDYIVDIISDQIKNFL